MPRTEPTPAMRVGRHLAQRLLLRAGARERRESGADAPSRRTEPETSVLWQPATDSVAAARRPVGQSQTGGALAGADGGGSNLSQAQLEPTRRGAPDLSLPLGRAGNHG